MFVVYFTQSLSCSTVLLIELRFRFLVHYSLFLHNKLYPGLLCDNSEETSEGGIEFKQSMQVPKSFLFMIHFQACRN